MARDYAAICFSVVFCIMGLGSGVAAFFGWRSVMAIAMEEFAQKTCIVQNFTVDSWEGYMDYQDELGNTYAEKIMEYLPKVFVLVESDLRINGGILAAYKYREENSVAPATSYDPNPKDWAAQFKVNTKVPCWQSTENPEVVKLDSGHNGFTTPSLVIPIMMSSFAVVLCIAGCFGLWKSCSSSDVKRYEHESDESVQMISHRYEEDDYESDSVSSGGASD
mmetsp:Transcript_135671/g.234548  ORF Transcript_135671/g.234548 Transcript_135671/m.234548 type:complete len:221 (-) Transcript_135671:216-878(-)